MNEIDPHDKKLVRISEILFSLSLLLGVGGWWTTQNFTYVNIALMGMGVVCVCFNRVINLERIRKYNLNHKFFRLVAVLVGLSFIFVNLSAIIKLL